MKKIKLRLDVRVLELNPNLTRNQIQSLIMQGKVFVEGHPCIKPGAQVNTEATVMLVQDTPKYVSRAGLKLEKALSTFGLKILDLVVLDAGISTGGFTDCLLQHGAKRVYGVDVGYGQVHEKIRNDPRVVLFEKTNLRYLEALPEKVDLVTLDLSFISILKVMPAICKHLKVDSKIITLIKPQFEAEREDIARGGVIKDDSVHQQVIEKMRIGMLEFGFAMQEVIESPILGATSGNKEFLALFTRK